MASIPLIQKDISMLNEKIEGLTESLKDINVAFQEHMKEEMETFKEMQKESEKRHQELLDRLETKFAGKWTEKVLIYVGTLILTAIVGATLSLIIIK